jgi:hypothetical protein
MNDDDGEIEAGEGTAEDLWAALQPPPSEELCRCGNHKSVEAICCAECTTEKKERLAHPPSEERK